MMRDYIATTLGGLEPVLVQELEAFGAQDIEPGQRMARFKGDVELLYQICYSARTTLRVLEPLASFRIQSEKDLYWKTFDLPWRKVLGPDQTFAITGVINSRLFPHTNYPSLVVKDALCDRIRRDIGRRPDVDRDQPDIRVNLHIFEDQVDIALDAVGSSMHMRGYRRYQGLAPLNEVLAAGLIRLAGWTPDIPLWDPMCGSGTILTEAAEWAIGRPSQIRRGRFGFQGWIDHEPGIWRKVKLADKEETIPAGLELFGADRDPEIIDGARKNIRGAGLGEIIMTEVCDFFDLKPPGKPVMIIMNPPYDEKIPLEEAEDFYKRIGDKLKQDFTGSTAWILSANKNAMRQIGLQSSQRYQLFNGPLAAEFCQYELF